MNNKLKKLAVNSRRGAEEIYDLIDESVLSHKEFLYSIELVTEAIVIVGEYPQLKLHGPVLWTKVYNIL